MDINSPTKRLLINTVRVDTELDDGSRGSGTAFIVSHRHGNKATAFVVTNRHLVEGVRRGGLVFTVGQQGKPLIGQRFQLDIDEFPQAWFLHPDPSIDLAVIPLAPLEQAANERGVDIYYQLIDTSLVPEATDELAFDALEEVLFVGYPSGVWDQVNLMPILRRGTTATPPQINFEGRREFLIDAAVYPGSSGSPVFFCASDGLASRITSDTKFFFAGVVAAVFFRQEQQQLVPAPVPANNGHASVMGSEMIDLGLVIKSSQVVHLINAYLSTWKV